MDIFSVFSLVGGLALFLYGMSLMSTGLERIAGGKLEGILKKMTSTPLKGLALGVVITGIIQSSSAVTVMLVGLVNSGLMELPRTVGVLMGSNIGTTVTAWILSLVGISGDNIFLKLLKPESFSPILAIIGVIMMMTSKTTKKKDIGTVLIGFAILMYGMEFMSDSVKPLASSPSFTSIITAFNNPLLGILTGLVLTAIIQSSSASVGILEALSLTGGITYGMAIPIIMGQNIGTCVTALLSSIGVSKNAKRVAVIHISFNVIGTAIFMVIYFIFHNIVNLPIIDQAVGPVGIAVIHTGFNVGTTVLLLPFQKYLVKIAMDTIKVEETPEIAFLDPLLMKTPSIAVRECGTLNKEMAQICRESIKDALALMKNFDEKKVEEIKDLERKVDIYEDKLGGYLVQLSGTEISDSDSMKISKMLHTIGNFERISDHARNIAEAAQELHDKGLSLSEEAQKELGIASSAIDEIIDISFEAFINNDFELVYRVEPLEEVIDDIIEILKLNHIKRLKKGICTIEQGFVLSDILNNYERVSDHCSNIAVAMIETSMMLGAHEYLDRLYTMDDPDFRKMYKEYKKKYKVAS